MTITDRQVKSLKSLLERGDRNAAIAVLKEIAPEAFKASLIKHIWTSAPAGPRAEAAQSILLCTRGRGSLEGQFYLAPHVDWSIERDDSLVPCLVARERLFKRLT